MGVWNGIETVDMIKFTFSLVVLMILIMLNELLDSVAPKMLAVLHSMLLETLDLSMGKWQCGMNGWMLDLEMLLLPLILIKTEMISKVSFLNTNLNQLVFQTSLTSQLLQRLSTKWFYWIP